MRKSAVPFLDSSRCCAPRRILARYQAWRSVYSIVSGFVRNEKCARRFLPHPARRRQSADHHARSTPSFTSSTRRRRLVRQGGTNALVRGMAAHFERLGAHAAARRSGRGDRKRRRAGHGRANEERLARRVRRGRDHADVVHSYDLIEGHGRGPAAAAKLRRKRFSPSLFVGHFGLRGSWPEVRTTTSVRSALPGLLGDIYSRASLPDDPSLYVPHPTATDPDMAPPRQFDLLRARTGAHLGSCRSTGTSKVPPIAIASSTSSSSGCCRACARGSNPVSITPAGFRRRSRRPSGLGVQPRAAADPERWFRTHNRDYKSRTSMRRRGHPSGRGHPRSRRQRAGHGGADDRRSFRTRRAMSAGRTITGCGEGRTSP